MTVVIKKVGRNSRFLTDEADRFIAER